MNDKRGQEPAPLLSGRPLEWSKFSRVAWVRSGALGDLVVGLASLAEMANFFPNAKVTVVGPALWTELLDATKMTFVERIIVVPRKKTFGQSFRPKGSSWEPEQPAEHEARPLSRLLSGYEAIVNTNIDSYRYGLAALRAGIGVRIGSAPPEMAWLYHYNGPFFGKDPLLHERDVPLLLMEYAVGGWARFFTSVARHRRHLQSLIERSCLVAKWRKQGLPALRDFSASDLTGGDGFGVERGRYVLINPTSSRREKAWPAECFRALLLQTRARMNELGLEALIIGSPAETDWLREVAGTDFRLIQPKSLRDLQAVVQGARALLTNVSSMQFIAATTQTPTLTLVGRSQTAIWGPVGGSDQVVRAELSPAQGPESIFEQEVRAYRALTPEKVASVWLPMVSQVMSSSRSSDFEI